MLFVPYSTDAPIYHWPIATVSLIVVNTLVFVACVWALISGAAEMEDLETFSLSYETINPIQWVTSGFMHAGPMHLLGNMFFLWAFGLIVEGKIGTWRFLLIYMAIAIGECAIEQVLMLVLVGEGGSVGASSAIFGLMMIAVIWAPENEIECVFIFALALFFIKSFSFEVKVVTLAMFFLLLQVAGMMFSGFSVSSELLHLLGAAVGAPLGVWMLRTNRVDCEGWDVITRNEWLQEYDWLCPPERREELRRAEATHYDPVAAALASKHSQVDPNSVYARKNAAKAEPETKRGLLGRKKKTVADPRARVEAEMAAAQSHPDFNRLSMLLRQAIASGSLNVANANFVRLEQLGIASGLSDKTLFDLAKLYAAAKQFVPATRPLQLIADRGGEMAADAWIRIAQIQFKVMTRADLAIASLGRIAIDAAKATESQKKLLARRDQLLALCRAAT